MILLCQVRKSGLPTIASPGRQGLVALLYPDWRPETCALSYNGQRAQLPPFDDAHFNSLQKDVSIVEDSKSKELRKRRGQDTTKYTIVGVRLDGPPKHKMPNYVQKSLGPPSTFDPMLYPIMHFHLTQQVSQPIESHNHIDPKHFTEGYIDYYGQLAMTMDFGFN